METHENGTFEAKTFHRKTKLQRIAFPTIYNHDSKFHAK